MNDKQKKKFLLDEGFKHGDRVSFRVENQASGCYVGPLNGILILDEKEYPYILSRFKGKRIETTINEGYDAYIGTITKYESLVDEEAEDSMPVLEMDIDKIRKSTVNNLLLDIIVALDKRIRHLEEVVYDKG